MSVVSTVPVEVDGPQMQEYIRVPLSKSAENLNGSASPSPIRVFALKLTTPNKVDLGRVVHAVEAADESVQSMRGSRWFPTQDRDAVYFSLVPLHDEFAPRNGRWKQSASHVCVSRRGVAVFVNCDIADAVYFLDLMRGIARSQPASTHSWPSTKDNPLRVATDTNQAWESTALTLQPSISTWAAKLPHGNIMLRKLDLDSIRVIATVLSKSILLHYYEQRTDALFAASEDVVEALRTATPKKLPSKFLSSVLTECNSLQGEFVLSNFSSSAHPGSPSWLHPDKYLPLEEMLMDEFEVRDRLSVIQRRLGYVSGLMKLSLGAKKDMQVHRLEYMIIVILVLEVVLKLWQGEVSHEEVET